MPPSSPAAAPPTNAHDFLCGQEALIKILVALSGSPTNSVKDNLGQAKVQPDRSYVATIPNGVTSHRYGDVGFHDIKVIADPIDEREWAISIHAEAQCGAAKSTIPVECRWSPANPHVLVFEDTPSQPAAAQVPLPHLREMGELGAGDTVSKLLDEAALAIPGGPSISGDGPPIDGVQLVLIGAEELLLDSSRVYFKFDVDWTLFPGVLKFEHLAAGVGRMWAGGHEAGQPTLSLAGEILVGSNTHLIGSISFPDVAVSAELDTAKAQPTLREFFADFGLKEAFWPSELRLKILRLAYEPKQEHHFLFDCEVDGHWKIFSEFALEDLFFHLERSGSGDRVQTDIRFGCSLRLFTGKPSEFAISLLAERRPLFTGQTQVLVEGSVTPGQPILFGEMIEELVHRMGVNSFELPGFLHELAIFDFHMALEILEEKPEETELPPFHRKRFSAGFRVGSAGGNWVILPGLLEIAPVDIDVVIGEAVDIRIRDTIKVFEADWMIDVQVPSLCGSVDLCGELALNPLFEHFHLPPHGFQNLKLVDASIRFDAAARSVAVHLELNDVWTYGAFQLHDVQLGIDYVGGEDGSLAADFSGTAKIDSVDIHVQAVHAGSGLGWRMEGSVEVDGGLSVADVATQLGMGDAVKNLGPLLQEQLTHLGVRYDTHTQAFAADCTIELSSTVTVELALERYPEAVPEGAAPSFEVRFSGSLKAGEVEFDLIFARDGGNSDLIASYVNHGGGPLSLGELVKAFAGADVAPEELNGLILPIKSAIVVREREKKEKAEMLLAADMDIGIDLAALGNLPLVGAAFRDEHRLTLGFTPIYTTGDFSKERIATIHALCPPGAPLLPDEELQAKQLTLTTAMMLGTHRLHLDLDLAGHQSPLSPQLGSPTARLGSDGKPQKASASPLTAATKAATAVHWIEANQRLGKVLNLRRIGVGLRGDEVQIAFDGAISVGPLSLDVMGLEASYNLKDHGLAFALTGLGLEVRSGSLEISAAFANLDGDFVGRASLILGEFGLTALGAFTMLDGHPSMFIYGILNAPLGGPVFFFVEGLAAGFGFNRHLIVPSIDQVHEFPFVKDAISQTTGSPAMAPTGLEPSPADSLGAELQKLHDSIHPEIGAIFIAAGIKFNSFRVVDVFALLVVMLDLERKRVQLALMGVATLKLPSDSPEWVAFLELNVLATVDPDEGVALFQAQLTPLSWVLSPDCHLQGGFAAGLWARGDHAGDFVYTLGGYHPQFPIPAHFPRPPRLGFHWNIGSEIAIRGELYYAFTPVAIMGGGCLSATWQSGGLRAWFTLQADFLAQWKPVQFAMSMNIEIGASYDSIFGTITFSLGAGVELWGPCSEVDQKMGGRAHFSYGPVSFAIDFGGSRRGPAPVSWEEFRTAFLPPAGKLCKTNVTTGRIRTLTVDQVEWTVVDPRKFELNVASATPVTHLRTGANGEPQAFDSSAIGVAPMGRTAPAKCTMAVTIKHRDGDLVEDEFDIKLAPKAFPGALWGQGLQNAASPRTVPGAGELLIKPASLPVPGASASIRRAQLSFDPQGRCQEARARTVVAAAPPTADRTKRAAIQAEVTQALDHPASSRAELLDALGFDPVRVTATSGYLQHLRATPRLRRNQANG